MVVDWKGAEPSARAQRLGIHQLPLLGMKRAVPRIRRGDLRLALTTTTPWLNECMRDVYHYRYGGRAHVGAVG